VVYRLAGGISRRRRVGDRKVSLRQKGKGGRCGGVGPDDPAEMPGSALPRQVFPPPDIPGFRARNPLHTDPSASPALYSLLLSPIRSESAWAPMLGSLRFTSVAQCCSDGLGVARTVEESKHDNLVTFYPEVTSVPTFVF